MKNIDDTSRPRTPDRPQPKSIASPTNNVLELLRDDQLIKLILSNKATLAMIRPNIANSMKAELIESSPEETLERNIVDLNVLLKFSFVFDLIAIDEFYIGKAKQDQKERPPEKDLHMPNRWAEFVGIMTAGPTIGLVLSSDKVGATETWRKQVGSWNIEQAADPSTLRGKFGIHNYNNLLHGSDNPSEACREINIIAQCIDRNHTDFSK
ncbi:MAG TPA: nucleoside-diphosphate kinase [Candidatus Chromulinivoraceae bacterium]|nr:nucleoside-diphosphate kinase [Candidatus Chromulinivoraceae bacterium]